MVQALNPPVIQAALTLADFLALPETKPASEFMDGEIVQKPMPQGKHSAIRSELIQKLAHSFPELRCTFDGRSIVPDITVFKTDRIPRDPDGTVANDFDIAPDWTIEILSPDQSQTKVVKNRLYRIEYANGVERTDIGSSATHTYRTPWPARYRC
jgi:Uma2 family endonuclease